MLPFTSEMYEVYQMYKLNKQFHNLEFEHNTAIGQLTDESTDGDFNEINFLMITDKAICQLHKIMNKNNSEYIRLHLNKRGCNGFSFSMNHTNLKDKNDELVEKMV